MLSIHRFTPCLLAFLLFVSTSSGWALSNDPIEGRWITYDDHTGEKRSIVSIIKKENKIFGKIEHVFFKPGDEEICSLCKGDKHNQNVIGLEVINGLSFGSGCWQGGTILDPKNGKEYRCKIWIEGEELRVRGFLFIFSRTQIWKKIQRN